MTQTVTCACGRALHVRNEYLGKRLKCPACGAIIDSTAAAITAPKPTPRQRGAGRVEAVPLWLTTLLVKLHFLPVLILLGVLIADLAGLHLQSLYDVSPRGLTIRTFTQPGEVFVAFDALLRTALHIRQASQLELGDQALIPIPAAKPDHTHVLLLNTHLFQATDAKYSVSDRRGPAIEFGPLTGYELAPALPAASAAGDGVVFVRDVDDFTMLISTAHDELVSRYAKFLADAARRQRESSRKNSKQQEEPPPWGMTDFQWQRTTNGVSLPAGLALPIGAPVLDVAGALIPASATFRSLVCETSNVYSPVSALLVLNVPTGQPLVLKHAGQVVARFTPPLWRSRTGVVLAFVTVLGLAGVAASIGAAWGINRCLRVQGGSQATVPVLGIIVAITAILLACTLWSRAAINTWAASSGSDIYMLLPHLVGVVLLAGFAVFSMSLIKHKLDR